MAGWPGSNRNKGEYRQRKTYKNAVPRFARDAQFL